MYYSHTAFSHTAVVLKYSSAVLINVLQSHCSSNYCTHAYCKNNEILSTFKVLRSDFMQYYKTSSLVLWLAFFFFLFCSFFSFFFFFFFLFFFFFSFFFFQGGRSLFLALEANLWFFIMGNCYLFPMPKPQRSSIL